MATSLYPLRLQPFARPMPWGGERLRSHFGERWPEGERVGEAWLLSDHALHASVVANGPLAGTSLRQLMADRADELLGFSASRFPLLIKLLDARENLSIQVHPDDELARQFAPGEGGKTEAWWVLEADPGSAIYLGLKPGFDRAALERELATGNLPLCLRRYEPKPGDLYFVPAGVIHALGGGCVVLEVQQTSDATFRLYDWGRVGPSGQPRQLHLREGLACTKESTVDAGPTPGTAGVRCPYFSMRPLHGPLQLTLGGRAHFLFGLTGRPSFNNERLAQGQSLLVPACLQGELKLVPGDAVMLVEIPIPE